MWRRIVVRVVAISSTDDDDDGGDDEKERCSTIELKMCAAKNGEPKPRCSGGAGDAGFGVSFV